LNIRIVELCPEFLPCPPRRGGAIETYVYGISKIMGKLGAEIHLVTIEKRQDVDYNGIYIHNINLLKPIAIKFRELFSIISPLNSNIPYLTMQLLKVFKEIEDLYGEVDVIHSHYFTTSFAPLILKHLKGGNVLTVGHLHNDPKRNIVNKELIEAYDAHLAVSNYVRKRTIDLLRVDPGKVGVVYNAVDTEFFKTCKSSEKVEKRKILGLKDDDFVIVFVGRIAPEKGLHHLLFASKILKQKGYNFKLLIAGPMGYFDRKSPEGYPKLCFELINRLNISNNAKYLGRPERHEIRDLYCVSDLIVVPSIWEDPCPSVVLEAMSMGKPVIAYASGGIPELIPPYGGIVVNKKDPRLLAEAIEMIIQGSITINNVAVAKWVRKRFSYEVVAQKLLRIFTEMQE
jgi:spore coat protein SA